MAILVTGGLGYLGGHIARSLAASGQHVTIIDKAPRPVEPCWLDSPGLKFVRWDLCVHVGLSEIVAGYDKVIHLAATSDTRASIDNFRIDLDNSVSATWNLLEALTYRGTCRHLIFASSQHVYGSHGDGEVLEDAVLSPVSSYGAAKAACEAIIGYYAKSRDLPATILRFSNIVGRGQRFGVLKDIIGKLQHNQKHIDMLGNGFQRRNFLHVEDLCSAVMPILSMDRKARVECFNVAHTDSMTVRRLVELVLAELRLGDCVVSFPSSDARGWRDDPGSIVCSTMKMRALRWLPRLNADQTVRRASRDLWENV